tara:strand:+ start:14289 stop:15233 length:945 start_codon:yes stop_codon:yes gene_type:complete
MSKLNKHGFSFDLTQIGTYTDEVGGLLISESIVKAITPSLCYLQAGVKGTQAINLLSSTISIGTGGCGWDDAANTSATTFTQRNLATKLYRYQESLCPTSLRDYWAGMFLNNPASNAELPFEAQIADLKVKEIQKFVEDKCWLATTGADGYDGFYTTISSGTTGVNLVLSATTPGGTNMLTCVDEVIAATPDAIRQDDDLIVFMSPSNYNNYVVSLRQSNFYAPYGDATSAGQDFITFHPATRIRVVGVPGLSGKNRIVLGKSSQMVIGVGLLDDTERLDMWYSRDNDEIRLQGQFNLATNIAFPENFVSNNLV